MNIHFAGFFEICKIVTPLHLWNPKWKKAWKNHPENPTENTTNNENTHCTRKADRQTKRSRRKAGETNTDTLRRSYCTKGSRSNSGAAFAPSTAGESPGIRMNAQDEIEEPTSAVRREHNTCTPNKMKQCETRIFSKSEIRNPT